LEGGVGAIVLELGAWSLGLGARRRREGKAEDAGVVDLSGMDHGSISPMGRLAAGGDRRDVNPILGRGLANVCISMTT